MVHKTLLENLCPGEILILYKETVSHTYPDITREESYVYARNDGSGLVIERAFVPDTQVKRKSQEEYNRLDEEQLEKIAKEIGAKLKARKNIDDELKPDSAFIHMLFSSV